MNIRLPLFWRTFGVGPGPGTGRTRPHVRAWRMGVIIAIVEPRSAYASEPQLRVRDFCWSLSDLSELKL